MRVGTDFEIDARETVIAGIDFVDAVLESADDRFASGVGASNSLISGIGFVAADIDFPTDIL